MRTLKNISLLVVLLLSTQANANDLTVLSAGGHQHHVTMNPYRYNPLKKPSRHCQHSSK